MTPEERQEQHRRRQAEAAEIRRRLIAEAADRRAEFRKRQSELIGLARDSRRGSAWVQRAIRDAFNRSVDWNWGPVRKRRRRGPEAEDGGVPVTPDRPRNLSGGAAAALDFEND